MHSQFFFLGTKRKEMHVSKKQLILNWVKDWPREANRTPKISSEPKYLPEDAWIPNVVYLYLNVSGNNTN